jgi:hypothetical protein
MCAAAVHAQQAAPPNRAARDTWTPVMSVLGPTRTLSATPAQLQRLRELPIEALWGALQTRQYVRSFEGGFQVSVDNPKTRLGGITVLPGDIIVADSEGVLAIPPQLVADVIKDAENTVYTENFKREMMRSRKYRARDIYPTLSPQLEKLFEEWKKSHPREGVKPNVGG